MVNVESFSFPLLHCDSDMDVYKCKCNTATNTKIIKIWAFRVDPIYRRYIHKRVIYWSCRTSTIYDLPINLQYIHKRVAALVDTESLCLGNCIEGAKHMNGMQFFCNKCNFILYIGSQTNETKAIRLQQVQYHICQIKHIQ